MSTYVEPTTQEEYEQNLGTLDEGQLAEISELLGALRQFTEESGLSLGIGITVWAEHDDYFNMGPPDRIGFFEQNHETMEWRFRPFDERRE